MSAPVQWFSMANNHPTLKKKKKSPDPRYLLCRPRGGLNDTLCRIELCWAYAEKFGRQLVIDTKNSSFFGDFDEYFSIVDQDSIIIHARLSDELLNRLNALSCRPDDLKGRVDSYKAIYIQGKGFCDHDSGSPTWFAQRPSPEADADCAESLLVYENSGGGSLSHDLLKRIRFSAEVSSEIEESLQSLKRPYYAVHVRNTDLVISE